MKIPKRIRYLASFVLPISKNEYTMDLAHMLEDTEALEKRIEVLEMALAKFISVIEGLRTSDAQHSQCEMTITLELQALYTVMNNKKTASANNDPAFE